VQNITSQTVAAGIGVGDNREAQALNNVLVPFPALSVPLGNMLAAIAASQLPMNSDCTGPGACDDPNAMSLRPPSFHGGAGRLS